MDETQAVNPNGNETTTEGAAPVAAEVASPEVASSDNTNLSVENLQKLLADTRKEAASYRRKLRDIEKAQEESKAELERKKPLEERLTTYEQQLKNLQAEKEALEMRTLEQELKEELLNAGVSRDYLSDALDLYVNAVQRVDEGEEPSLQDWLKSRPYLLAQTNNKPAPQPLPGANPAGKQVSASLTREDIGKMTSEEYAKHRANIFNQMKRGIR